ncbi:MAG: BON domain-containing protein [Bdellovibrionales bacterium]|nr:BON domain-containing protein [Bdellovibrionales bacterium]
MSKASTAKKEKSKFRRKTKKLTHIVNDQFPNIGVIANRKMYERLFSYLTRLNVNIIYFQPQKISNRRIRNSNLLALVVVPHQKISDVESYYDTLTQFESLRDTPLYILSRTPSAQLASDLYEKGASLVIDIETELEIADQLIAENLGIRLANGKPNDYNSRLQRSVRSHLSRVHTDFANLRIEAFDGVINVSGSLPLLARLKELTKALRSIPGILNIDTSGVHILTEALANSDIDKAIKEIVDSDPFLASSPIRWSVQRGIVTISGGVHNASILDKFIEKLEHLSGIKRLNNFLSVHQKIGQLNSQHIKSIEREIDTKYPMCQIHLEMVGSSLIAKGIVKDLYDKKEIQNYLEKDPRIEKVINRLFVA